MDFATILELAGPAVVTFLLGWLALNKPGTKKTINTTQAKIDSSLFYLRKLNTEIINAFKDNNLDSSELKSIISHVTAFLDEIRK